MWQNGVALRSTSMMQHNFLNCNIRLTQKRAWVKFYNYIRDRYTQTAVYVSWTHRNKCVRSATHHDAVAEFKVKPHIMPGSGQWTEEMFTTVVYHEKAYVIAARIPKHMITLPPGTIAHSHTIIIIPHIWRCVRVNVCQLSTHICLHRIW